MIFPDHNLIMIAYILRRVIGQSQEYRKLGFGVNPVISLSCASKF